MEELTLPTEQYQYLTTASCSAYVTIAQAKAEELSISQNYLFLVSANTAWFHVEGTDHQAIANTLTAAGQTSFAQLLASRDGQVFGQLKEQLAQTGVEMTTAAAEWDIRADYSPAQMSTVSIHATTIETAEEALVTPPLEPYQDVTAEKEDVIWVV